MPRPAVGVYSSATAEGMVTRLSFGKGCPLILGYWIIATSLSWDKLVGGDEKRERVEWRKKKYIPTFFPPTVGVGL